MSLYSKLVLFLVAVVVGPLLALGALLLVASEDALTERIRQAQEQAVRGEADAVAQYVLDQTHALSRTSSSFVLSDEARFDAAAKLIYRASPDASFVALVDATGTPRTPPIRYDNPGRAPEVLAEPARFEDIALHPGATLEMVGRIEAPLAAALAEGPGAVVMSPVYAVPERQDTAFLVLLPIRAGTEETLAFIVELSLRGLSRRARLAEGTGALAVVDGAGLAVAHADATRLRHAPFDEGEALLMASAPVDVPGLGWQVVAALPEAEAFAPVRRLRSTVLITSAVALVMLLALARLFVRKVRRGLDAVASGAAAFQRGDLTTRIDPPSEAELGALARTFNDMGAELEKARDKLVRWNEELEVQVEERTRDLKEAQARLIESQKLAAVGQLGAGVAHEINNPLSGVLGFVQLLDSKLKKIDGGDDESIKRLTEKIADSAKRCRDVTGTLLRFSQRAHPGEHVAVPMDEVLSDVVTLNRSQLDEAGVTIDVVLPDGEVPAVRGDAGEIGQVVLHLVTNARTAVSGTEDKRITLSAQRDGERVKLIVADTGKGMEEDVRERMFEPFFTTKEVWTNLGLGLYAAFRIVEDHGGTISVESRRGTGTTMTVDLPAA